MIAIGLAAGGGTDGLLVIYGAVIVAGLFTLLIAPYFCKLIRFFPPVVTGSVITIIGLGAAAGGGRGRRGGGRADLDPTERHEHGLRAGHAGPDRAHPARVFQRLHGRPSRCSIGLVVGTAGGLDPRATPTSAAVATLVWFGCTTPFYFGWPEVRVRLRSSR